LQVPCIGRRGHGRRIPFGHGLGFSPFSYAWDTAPAPFDNGSDGTGVRMAVALTNEGSVDGVEVMQVYSSFPESDGFPAAAKALKAFARVAVAAGATVQVSLEVPAAGFMRWDNTAWGWKAAPGPYRLSVGGSSRDLRLTADVVV